MQMTRTSIQKRTWILITLVFVLVSIAMAQQPAEMIIKNGQILISNGRVQGDCRIRNGLIAEIGQNLRAASDVQVIDATGKLVLPGGIDPHVHLTPERTSTTGQGADDFTSASRAALAGGLTTIGSFINQEPDRTAAQTLTHATDLAKKQAIVDVILHFVVSDPTKLSDADVKMLYDRQFKIGRASCR